KIPGLILKQMYTLGSLHNVEDGVRFSLKNRLANATLTRLREIKFDGRPVPLGSITLFLKDGVIPAADVSEEQALAFPLAQIVHVEARGDNLAKGPHEIAIEFDATPFGNLSFKVKDTITDEQVKRTSVPLDKENNYTAKIVEARQRFVEEYTG